MHLNKLLFSLCAALLLVSCSKPSPNTIVIGTIAGPETELVDVAQKVAQEKYDLSVKVVEFGDYNLPNEALQDGSLDANVYQHLPYLETAIQTHHYPFEIIGKTFVYPMGIYSNKITRIHQLGHGAIIAIPNDPSNETRALLLLQKAGLIQVKKNKTLGLHDITRNPKQLIIKELDAAQLPRVLQDVDAAVINTSFALPAGLTPGKDAIFLEKKDSPYANLIVIRKDTTKRKQLALFVESMHSKEVLDKANELFGEAAIPAW